MGSRMVLLDVAKDRDQYEPPFPQRVNDAIHQERGWPRQLVASEHNRTCPAPPELDVAAGTMARRMLNWLRGLRHSSVGGGPAAARERGTTRSATAH